tara:strand:+ start:1419 stop:2021 length:603 start_codon:yes stop_codon:yes gene_type:complete
MPRGKRKQKHDLDKIAVLLTNNKLQQLRNQEPYLSKIFLIESLKNLEAEQKVMSQLQDLRKLKAQQDEKAYNEISDFRSSSSGSAPPSFIANERDNMSIAKKFKTMKEHKKKKHRASYIDKVALRRGNSFQGNERTSSSRAKMTAKKLSETLVAENPYQEKAEYRSQEHKRRYSWGKTKKRTRKPSKKRKHKKRKSTRKQ